MTLPTEVKVDLEANAGYVRYRALPAGDRVARTVRLSGDIAVDFDTADAVLGIEILAFDADVLEAARQFAGSRGLAFPRDLAGALAAA